MLYTNSLADRYKSVAFSFQRLNHFVQIAIIELVCAAVVRSEVYQHQVSVQTFFLFHLHNLVVDEFAAPVLLSHVRSGVVGIAHGTRV